jgi:hypothetical protein
MSERDQVRTAQWEYLYQVTAKLGCTPFEIFPNFSSFRMGNDLTSIIFYAFRNQLRREWVESDHPVRMLEMVLNLVEGTRYAKVETQPNFVRFRFETHAELPFESNPSPLKTLG